MHKLVNNKIQGISNSALKFLLNHDVTEEQIRWAIDHNYLNDKSKLMAILPIIYT